ncbi:MAG: hypothetical protein KDE29_08145, partial [Anaerolineales bacterium]|nr:hypothetical protein [Anaerolineales bacterium]
ALKEGTRIINSIQNILKLFMVTVFALLLLIIGVSILGLGFPFTALQSTLLSFFARGAPPFVLAITAVAVRQKTSLSRNILHFTLPASFMVFLFGLFVYIGTFFLIEHGLTQVVVTPEMVASVEAAAGISNGTLPAGQFNTLAILLSAQTALTTFFVFVGILLMLFAEPPFAWFAGGAPYRGRNWLPVVVAIVLFLAYLLLLSLPRLQAFFSLVPLPGLLYAAIGVVALAWVFVQRWLWRAHWLERFLDMADDLETTTETPA